ncbi:MAG: DUF4279 domain-containing protein [Ignavibacteriae bacterium]|nr:DUF4279 domain-containing protein [Ignavibacteriota bacterium]
MKKFNDKYETCERTYATLCIYPNKYGPNFISETLNIKATKLQFAGEKVHEKIERKHKINAWFLSSKDKIESKDSRRHIQWIIDQIKGNEEQIITLQKKKIRMYIFCFWSSAHGHGGPTIDPEHMKYLGELNLEIVYDFYC